MPELDDPLEMLYSAFGGRIDELVESARQRVVSWRWAVPFVLAHRHEPLLHERLWLPRGRWIDTPTDLDGSHERCGYDADGELALVLTWGSTLPDGVPDGEELPRPWTYGWFQAGSIVLRIPGSLLCLEFSELRERDVDRWQFRLDGFIRYRFHDDRVTESEYLFGWGKDQQHSESGSERYFYDDRGGLVAIDEYANLSETTPEFGTRGDLIDVGGRLDICHAADPAQVTIHSGETLVWRAAPAHWPELLDQYAARAAHACRDAIVAWVSAEPQRSQRPVIAIFMDDYTQSAPGRGAVRPFESLEFGGGNAIWHHLHEVENWIDFDDEDGTLLRVGACAGRDVQTETSEAVARRLREFDWREVLSLSEDMLIYADHSENPEGECLASARRANPSEVVERWIARGWFSK